MTRPLDEREPYILKLNRLWRNRQARREFELRTGLHYEPRVIVGEKRKKTGTGRTTAYVVGFLEWAKQQEDRKQT